MQAPGEKLVERLWETVEKTIGGIFRPWQIRREGRAEIDVRREELLVLAQAEKDAEEIRAGRRVLGPGGLVIPAAVGQHYSDRTPGSSSLPDARQLPQAALNGIVADRLRAEVNVARALVHAESELSEETQEPPDRVPDPDWLNRWRASAAEVSTEQLQHLWGQVLAGEIKSPGAFSLRTIEFLRNLSQDEAKRIALLSRFVVNGNVIYAGSDAMAAEGITLAFLLDMQDLGLVAGVGSRLQTTWNSMVEGDAYKSVFASNRKALIVTHSEPRVTLHLSPVIFLTAVGREVLRLGTFDPHLDYLREIGTQFRQQSFQVALADYKMISGTEGTYSNAEELS
jgi:hypothetical protein